MAMSLGEPTVQLNDMGSAVHALQAKLASLGYAVGRVDGYYGPQTLAAVKAFQSTMNLQPDGIVGPKTWAALLDSQPLPPAPPVTVPTRPAFGSSLTVTPGVRSLWATLVQYWYVPVGLTLAALLSRKRRRR